MLLRTQVWVSGVLCGVSVCCADAGLVAVNVVRVAAVVAAVVLLLLLTVCWVTRVFLLSDCCCCCLLAAALQQLLPSAAVVAACLRLLRGGLWYMRGGHCLPLILLLR